MTSKITVKQIEIAKELVKLVGGSYTSGTWYVEVHTDDDVVLSIGHSQSKNKIEIFGLYPNPNPKLTNLVSAVNIIGITESQKGKDKCGSSGNTDSTKIAKSAIKRIYETVKTITAQAKAERQGQSESASIATKALESLCKILGITKKFKSIGDTNYTRTLSYNNPKTKAYGDVTINAYPDETAIEIRARGLTLEQAERIAAILAE